MSETDAREELKRYRRKRREVLFLYLAYVPGQFAVVVIAIHLHIGAFIPGIAFLFVWALIFRLKARGFWNLRCPICGRTVLTHPVRSCKLKSANL